MQVCQGTNVRVHINSFDDLPNYHRQEKVFTPDTSQTSLQPFAKSTSNSVWVVTT